MKSHRKSSVIELGSFAVALLVLTDNVPFIDR